MLVGVGTEVVDRVEEVLVTKLEDECEEVEAETETASEKSVDVVVESDIGAVESCGAWLGMGLSDDITSWV